MPGANNSDCYDKATLLKMLVPLAALPADDPTLPVIISPLSSVLAAAALGQISLMPTVRFPIRLILFISSIASFDSCAVRYLRAPSCLL